MRVPYVDLIRQHAPLKGEILAAVERVLDHGQFIFGPELELFEQEFAELCGVRYAVGVGSGTAALVMALQALGIHEGDEVITAANSFIASAACIKLVGARPVLVDVRDDLNMDPARIEEAITPRTRAIVVVHLTGRPADMGPIMDIAAGHGLKVVEDAAQSVGACYRGKKVGSFGDVGCFSLHPLKTLNACGEAGVLTTNDKALRDQFALLRNLGLRTRDDAACWAGNQRMDTLQAAIVLVKLRYLNAWTEKRRENARFYRFRLGGCVGVPIDRSEEYAVYHTFVIRTADRPRLIGYLDEVGVGTAVHYPVPIHLTSVGAELGYGVGSFPVTERLASEIVSLPVYPELGQEQLEYVASCVQNFYAQNDIRRVRRSA